MALSTSTQSHMTHVRCRCLLCGAHSMGDLGHTLGGNCQNCGSYELEAMIGAAILIGA